MQTPGVASYPPAEGGELGEALEGEGEAEEPAEPLHPDDVIRLIFFVELGGEGTGQERTGSRNKSQPEMIVGEKVELFSAAF